jgi:hypothetical protein
MKLQMKREALKLNRRANEGFAGRTFLLTATLNL